MSELTIRPGPPVRGKEVFALNYRWSALEPSPNGGEDGDVRELLQDGESILQMLQGIQKEISAATLFDDHVRRFEKLNRLFRCGVSPGIRGGLSRGQGEGCNACFDAPEAPDWYGRPEPCSDFDYYHGATLNLHFGFADTFCTNVEKRVAECATFPSALVGMLQSSP